MLITSNRSVGTPTHTDFIKRGIGQYLKLTYTDNIIVYVLKNDGGHRHTLRLIDKYNAHVIIELHDSCWSHTKNKIDLLLHDQPLEKLEKMYGVTMEMLMELLL